MADFSIRSDSVNVEQIMRQIRARIREKRGVDYTEQELQELAAAKLEKFLDPQKVRSELLQQFQQTSAAPPNYAFEDSTLFESHRALLRWVRRILRPILKLFFNPNPLIQALHIQSGLNDRNAQHSQLTYEVLHNLVVELTRVGIEVKNVTMRIESLSSRLDFYERRARALEGVVQYKAAAPEERDEPPGDARAAEDEGEAGSARRGRRRRRRGRRSGMAPSVGGGATGEHADAVEGGPPPRAQAEPQGDRGAAMAEAPVAPREPATDERESGD
jgi:hypothetical protein